MWDSVIELFRSYMGTGLVISFFLAAIIYLFLVEKEPVKRILFVYLPVILLVLYFNPLFAKVLYAVLDEEIYYRILWLMPVSIVLAYCVSDLYGKVKGAMKTVLLIGATVMIMLSGSLIYDNVNFRKAENPYHIPQTVVEICDAIEVEGREVMAVFPTEMIQYVRQYSPYVCMPYGRDVIEAQWGKYADLQLVMEAKVLVVEKMAPLAKAKGCHYIVVNQEKEILGDMREYDYELFASIGGYDVYLDTTIYAGL